VRDAARAALAEELPCDPDARVHGLRREGDEVVVRFEQDGRSVEERFERVLAAVGRRPNLADLDLERAGLTLDAHGVPRFDRRTMQCGDAPVFLAGDVGHDRPLLHEASDEGTIAGENAARFPDVRPGARRSPLAVVFTDPQLAMVGESWKELRGRDVVQGEVSFEDQGRSRVMLMNRGRLHVYADAREGTFLGAEMAGRAPSTWATCSPGPTSSG